jgi:hypothetical protein
MDWVDEELKNARLGDRRLNERYGLLLRRLGDAPQASIPAACRGLGETIAAYRFFDNDKVSAEKILEPHYAATLERLRPHPVVLLPQDTTELDYSDHPGTNGLGPLNSKRRLGFFQHLTLALTPERLCLGVVDVRIWARERLREKGEYKRLPIEEKESERWLWGLPVRLPGGGPGAHDARGEHRRPRRRYLRILPQGHGGALERRSLRRVDRAGKGKPSLVQCRRDA